MLQKDIIARRLDEGITYTEFSYMIMQAMDFWYLNKHRNVELQVAGQEKWGNITAGIELINRKEGKTKGEILQQKKKKNNKKSVRRLMALQCLF